jgi:hypothetical protein
VIEQLKSAPKKRKAMSAINRRQFIAGTTTVAATSALSACGNPDQQTVVRPEGVPISPFGAKSTALEVTEGLDLTGQTAFITGCNSGLGLETMRVLSLRGANIIGAARTKEKAETAISTLDGPGVPVVCELGDLESVAACGETVKQLGTPIDMLILNAGIMALPELEQINGIEKQFFVNHLGHFTLTSHLLKQVEAAPQGRIVVVSSSGHQFAPDAGIDFTNLSGEQDYDPWGVVFLARQVGEIYAVIRRKLMAAATHHDYASLRSCFNLLQ